MFFFKKVPSHGVKKGIIEDENLLVNDIKGVVQEANDFLDGEIKAVGLTIPTIRSKLIKVIVVYHLVIMIRFLRMIL